LSDKRKLQVEVGGEKAVIELFWDKAPNICKGVWSVLPLESYAFHGKVVDNEYMIPLPIFLERENMVAERHPGDVGWWDARGVMNIWYGEATVLGPTGIFGKVVKNLEGLQREGRKLTVKQGGTVKLSKLEE